MPFLTDQMNDRQRQDKLAAALSDENSGTTAPIGDRSSPVPALASRFSFDLQRIEDELRTSIIGQDEAIEQVLEILKVVRVDIGDPRKPLASVLFCGPTGVGKTETVRTIARAMYGDADAFCRVDMNTLSQEHYAAAITGAPPGYVGSKEGTTILDQEKIEGTRNLPGLVLFDELEKASNEVVLALMNVFDNGLLTVASGERTYSFRNSLIFMSSNLGARDLMMLDEKATGFRALLSQMSQGRKKRSERAHDIVMSALLERFPPELVNRIDHIDTFNWIDSSKMPDLVDVELQRLNRRLKKHGLWLDISSEVRDFIALKGYDKRFGARGLRRSMRRYLEFPLAGYLLGDQGDFAPPEGNEIVKLFAQYRNDAVSFQQMSEKE
ncbi:Chaperone protein ClpB [Thalassovita gelatinovora]|uniref:Chaperone protein ClpB n=1 Tax=Thalassovita gelatinovora TaxID=53501 RepID=A0A0N7LVX0_THAGE|nr:AAA family ATPase [Thalassovita gelatinovora]QIZ82013.1 ATP-dependent Clp protease ATP-binding subunit [Thalassovita gelatinovora]CUH67474.1 Chaperone protein ClpB [Thalassovita gelatinovora]SEP73319.1 C-terminal, D2-small domain-containing protein, of ClpB protein [Thalassovita gelatinovora]